MRQGGWKDGNELRHTQVRGWSSGHESEGQLTPDMEPPGSWAPPPLPYGLWGQRSNPSPQEGPAPAGPPPPGEARCEENRGWESMLSPQPNMIPITMTTQPRPQGHSATRNVTAPPPRSSPDWGGGYTHTHPTPKPGVWHLGPGLCLKPQLGLEGPGPFLGSQAWGGGRGGASPWPGHLGPVTSQLPTLSEGVSKKKKTK